MLRMSLEEPERTSGAAAAFRFENALGRGRKLQQHLSGPYRTADQLAPAIGAALLKTRFRAIRAECAFEGTNPRIGAVGRQVSAAALAIRP